MDPPPEDPDVLVLTVALRSGRFKDEIEISLSSSETFRRAAIADWLDLIEECLRRGGEAAGGTDGPG